ncbi:hypothetical protein G5V58_21855 [Nocardioides anomalus]|uniref:Uncharacterized protein n=1 Tax=Nocardioides anomalus TaxID=2712223 RepID=A0A6G6WIM5_9ACTN|nr:hypothetical protein [Nocardioides anomalus]QIG45056.1 hypothetical protein G5V58_21855 [Nocardioides anomalus]
MPRVPGAVALAALLLGVAGPASATTTVAGRDPARDVLSRGVTDDGKPHHPEPAQRVGDIVRLTATYGSELVVTTKVRQLSSRDDQDFSWLLRTSEDRFTWFADYTLPAGRDRGIFVLIDPVANEPDCGSVRLDRAARTVTLIIPADCLGSPAWVRVAHGVRVYSPTKEYADDAQRAGDVRNSGWRFGPELGA